MTKEKTSDATAKTDKAEKMVMPLAWWGLAVFVALFALVLPVGVCLLLFFKTDSFESTKVCVLFLVIASLYVVLVGIIAWPYYKSSAKICLKQLSFMQEMRRIDKLVELAKENDNLGEDFKTDEDNASNKGSAPNAVGESDIDGKSDAVGNQDKKCRSDTVKRIIEAEITTLQNANR